MYMEEAHKQTGAERCLLRCAQAVGADRRAVGRLNADMLGLGWGDPATSVKATTADSAPLSYSLLG